MSSVVLKSSDNRKFKVNIDLAKCFGVTKNAIEFCSNAGAGDEDSIIPLPTIEGSILEKVIEWAFHTKNTTGSTMQLGPLVEQHTVEEQKMRKTVWETEFLNVNTTILFKLLMAAKYLDCPALIDLTANEIARLMHGKTPSEIRHHFNIENDLSCQEEEENAL